MQAPDRPRRPIRRMQRTRPSCRASSRTTCQVPSGELSSTKMTSQATPESVASQPPEQRGDVVALVEGRDDDRKLQANAAACGGVSGPGLMASFMRPAYSRRLRACQGAVPVVARFGERSKRAKQAPKMPTTTNNRRAYIRRSRAIPWSSQRRSYEASTSPLNTQIGTIGAHSARGCLAPSARRLPARLRDAIGPCGWDRLSPGHFPDHRPSHRLGLCHLAARPVRRPGGLPNWPIGP